MNICFVASSGGHFEQLMMLYPMMKEHNSHIITEKTDYGINSKGIKTYFVTQINRRELLFILKIVSILIKSIIIFIREKPDVVISTGALATVPICVLAKLFRKKLIFIESFSKIHSPTITGRIMYKFADLFIVQWEEMKKIYPNAKYGGGIY
ncbi:polysaccharide biosynthesis protein [Bacillus sp. FJAT-27225]|uniref:PssD/Cps14F family polysaccharide biosynthesis glycosyltransferase n=1 Tax=Bacillus sp. FJAT-27225 TaxID=1743144 RepID=UPI00080C232D|nr:PssD/Cps14F family polysaccharide biosynthesis glycosyltransferase [Bacillus sp. FJAT-27225]OCA87894.1 polysaccharide biosynthesis protein [Bacillus sp. FJAT-27225]